MRPQSLGSDGGASPGRSPRSPPRSARTRCGGADTPEPACRRRAARHGVAPPRVSQTRPRSSSGRTSRSIPAGGPGPPGFAPRHLGHGTDMAGIIAGSEGGKAPGAGYAADGKLPRGRAPDARIVSLQARRPQRRRSTLADDRRDRLGRAEPKADGMDIRVLNLQLRHAEPQRRPVRPPGLGRGVRVAGRMWWWPRGLGNEARAAGRSGWPARPTGP